MPVEVEGLREWRDNFASLPAHAQKVALDRGSTLTVGLREVYRANAPYDPMNMTGLHFRDTFVGTLAPSLTLGFTSQVETPMADRARWFRQGTGIYAGRGRIYPRHAKALGPVFNWAPLGPGPFWFRSIRGMPRNPWQAVAFDESGDVIKSAADGIGSDVARALTP